VIYHAALQNQLDEAQGFLEIRYSSSNSGTMCAKVYDSAGGSHLMSVSIRRADWRTVWSDSGTFSTYAGGVEVLGAATHCVAVSGNLSMGSRSVDKFRKSAYINKYGSPC
jgi:hypothetical protein